jgi:hypothetical protein
MKAVIELATALEQATGLSQSLTIADYWAQLFGCDSQSPDFHLAMAALQSKMIRVIQVLQDAEISERSKNLYLNAAGTLLPFVMGSQVRSLNVASLLASQQNINVLYLAAEVLSDEAAPEINPLTLEALEIELVSLIDELKSSDLPMALRHAVEAQLTTLLIAVRSYGTLGQEGFARLFGTAMAGTSQIIQANPTQGPQGESIFKKTIAVIQKAGAAIVWASATVGGVHGLIEDGTAIAGLLESTPEAPSGSSNKPN